MKRILITGGAGFLGGALVRELSDRFDVVGLGSSANESVSPWIRCDLRDAAATKLAVASFAPDVVVHCAALSKIGVCEAQPLECEAVNVQGSEHLAVASIEAGVSAVVGLSSDRVFQASQNQYGRSKAAMEKLFVALAGNETSFVPMRLGKVPGSPGGFLDHWKAAFESTGEIESTGPEHASFFLMRAAFVRHVELLIARAHEWSGHVYVPDMKVARMRDILDVWVAEFGGSWKDTSLDASQAPESSLLISGEERARSQHFIEDDLGFYLIAPTSGERAEPERVLTTADAEVLASAEILDMLREAGVAELKRGGSSNV